MDVLKFPVHSKAAPEFVGECQIDGKQSTATIIAVLDGSASESWLPAKKRGGSTKFARHSSTFMAQTFPVLAMAS
jgi:hypothetical protein